MEVPRRQLSIHFRSAVSLLSLLATIAATAQVRAETGYDAWLRYPPVDAKTAQELYGKLPAIVVMVDEAECVQSARDEFVRGVHGMLGRILRIDSRTPKEGFVFIGTYAAAKKALPTIDKFPEVADDGFWLKTLEVDGENCLLVTAPNDRGVLYGTFAVLRKIALGQPIASLNEQQAPHMPLRMLNHFDRLDGTLDHGGVGKSIFWESEHVVDDLGRVRDYARLLASIGVNGISINNPDAGPRLLTPEYLKQLARVSRETRPWGVRLFIALNSTSLPPGATGRSEGSGDAREESWKRLVDEIYREIPDLGGFVLQADWGGSTEASVKGPAQADAVNKIAAALQPHGGLLFCRTCRCHIDVDPSDPKADAAKAAFDLFHPLDGTFADNVILQIKHGPMDFQVREPPSPLFGALAKTNQAIELDITQQYRGQQRHLCFLAPMWKEVLDFNMHAGEGETPVRNIVAGRTFARAKGAMVALANVSRADNWLGHDLAMANLYGFGRLAWNPELSGKAVAEEWSRLTFGHDPLVVGALVDMLLKSWHIYESYTGPLGAGSLTDLGEVRYGPGIESASPGSWAPWHSADATGIGKDRTAKTGTGFIAQYMPPVAERFESLDTCPESLLLFMHHVPYTHVLKSGDTVIQHIYDVHYQGARDAARLVQQCRALDGRIDDQRYEAVLEKLQYQAGHAKVWRDAVCGWFLQKSGIADNEGRVGHYPNRFEAEALALEGYQPQNVKPWETASGGQCAECVSPDGKGAAGMKFDGKPGWYNINVAYFDENDGVSKFRLVVAGQVIEEWAADDLLPDNKPNGHTSARHQSARVALRPGDEIRIQTVADGGERAAIDYLEIDPADS